MLAFQLKGVSKLLGRTDRVKKSLDNRKKANSQAVMWVDRWIQKNFQTEGRLSMGGRGWKPLSPAAIAARRKGRAFRSISHRPMILQDIGTLRSRWKHLWTATTALIQSGVDYAKIHHRGSPARGLAARKITPTKKQVWPDIRKIYRAFIKKALR